MMNEYISYLSLLLKAPIQFQYIWVVQKALDLNLLCQLVLHLVLEYDLFLYDFQSNHDLGYLLLSLEHVTELAPPQELANLEPLTDSPILSGQYPCVFGDVLGVLRLSEVES